MRERSDAGQRVRAVPLHEIELRASRSSGPGGQHANVTASRIEAVFDIAASAALTEAQKRRLAARHGEHVTAVAQDARSQARNRELALERLREKLAAGLAVPRKRARPGRRERRGSAGWREAPDEPSASVRAGRLRRTSRRPTAAGGGSMALCALKHATDRRMRLHRQ